MGYLSVLLVRHDSLHAVEKDKDVGMKIGAAVTGYNRRNDSHYISGGLELVAGSIHASDFAVVVVEGNTAYHVENTLRNQGSLPNWSKAERHLVEILKNLGYKVTRPRQMK